MFRHCFNEQITAPTPAIAERLPTRLARNVSGSTMAMMAAGLIPAIAALGGAIDVGRMYVVKSQLQAGADAAALAGARAFQITGTNKTETCAAGEETDKLTRCGQAKAYFYGNFPATYMGVSALTLTPKFTTDDEQVNTTTITATATLGMSFMQAFGFQPVTLQATAKAQLQPRPLEVMVVLDNTGSMRFTLSSGRTRIQALKTAAADFVDILYQGATQRSDLALGFIPYDTTVNVGHLDGMKGSVVAQAGFNGKSDAAWPGNRLGWKGCVMNDSTIRDLSTNLSISEPGAWDITRTIPGTDGAPKVEPYFVPPVYFPNIARDQADAAQATEPTSQYYVLSGGMQEGYNNLYRVDVGTAKEIYDRINSPIYRKYFFDYYRGLNGDKNENNDVIRKESGTGVYSINDNARDLTDWKVVWGSIPNYGSYFTNASDSVVNPLGGQIDSKTDPAYLTAMPSPNWQCPEEALPLAYNRQKSDYINYINNKNAAIMPGNGTIHHAGLLWGYRLLVQDQVFKRTNPTNEKARRALVFMTDGEAYVNDDPGTKGFRDRVFTWYGKWSKTAGVPKDEPTDTSSSISSTRGKTMSQALLRFQKTCANLQREVDPPKVYIIALATDGDEIAAFNQCAPGRVYRTNSTDELRKAFQDVASELVDLHLVQ